MKLVTGKIEDFLVHDHYLYRKVFNHVKECDHCDPNEIMQIYFDRRISNPKFKGCFSVGLVRLCDRYRKLPRWDQNNKLYEEILVRQWSIGPLFRIGQTHGQILKEASVVFSRYHLSEKLFDKEVESIERLVGTVKEPKVSLSNLEFVRDCATVHFKIGKLPETPKEVRDLAIIYEVLES